MSHVASPPFLIGEYKDVFSRSVKIFSAVFPLSYGLGKYALGDGGPLITDSLEIPHPSPRTIFFSKLRGYFLANTMSLKELRPKIL